MEEEVGGFNISTCKESLKENCVYVFDRCGTGLDSIVDVGAELGKLVPDVYGCILQPLKAKPVGCGARGSFTYVHGLASFPWHTDTAFWEVPCKYLLLTSDSANDCPTFYIPFRRLVSDWEMFQDLAMKAIFKMVLPSGVKLVHFQIGHGANCGYRYDQHIMFPYNEAAKLLDAMIQDGLSTSNPIEVKWTGHNVVVLDNWQGIHSRGEAFECPDRMLYRLYIE